MTSGATDDGAPTHEMGAMTPAGLLRIERSHLRKLAIVYVVLAVLALAVPAALAQPRGESPHHMTETSRR